jgi:O-antigen ligase
VPVTFKSFLVLFFKKELLPSFLDLARLIVLAALPLVGLLVGPAYASMAWALGALGLVSWWVLKRPAPVFDRQFVAVGAAFCGLCLLGSLWSIAPQHTLRAAGQLAVILAASLIVVADRTMRPAVAARAFGVMSLALFLGVAVMCVDHVLHFALERRLAGHSPYPGTKYNRGEDYLTLLLWPLLAFWLLQARYGRALLVVAAVFVAVAVGLSTTARVTLPAGFCVLVAAWIAPRVTMRVLTWGSVAMTLSLPFVLRALAADRWVMWHHLKLSGLHRLEIWDYMTARVFERPWFGWGFSTAKLVPIRAEEQRGFVYVDPNGVYPHNQLLQLWLETGVAGVALGLVFVLLVLRRIDRLPPRLYPFGCAAFAAACVVSASSFELTTDSWWAALALTAVLLHWAGQAAMP